MEDGLVTVTASCVAPSKAMFLFQWGLPEDPVHQKKEPQSGLLST